MNQQQQATKSNEIRELQQMFSLTALNDRINQEYQECYIVGILPYMQIKMYFVFLSRILQKDYPQSQAKFYALEHLNHYLIDDATWQIRVDRRDTLKNIIIELRSAFERNPPQQDPYKEELTNLKTKTKEQLLIQRIQQVDLRTLFKGVPVAEYKKIVEGGKIQQYIEQLPEYKELAQYIIELGKTNENFAGTFECYVDHLIEQDLKIKHQKAELINLAAYFDKLRIDLNLKEQECKEVQNKLDPYHLVRQFDEQINQLDELSNDRIEELNGSTIIVNQKFDDELQAYYNLRKQQHKLQIKKDLLEQSLLEQKKLQQI